MKLPIFDIFDLITQQFPMVQSDRVYLVQSNFNFFTNALLLLPLLIFKLINLPPHDQELTAKDKICSSNYVFTSGEGYRNKLIFHVYLATEFELFVVKIYFF